MKTPQVGNFLPWALLALILTSCGGGTGGTGTTGGSSPAVSVGVMENGSIIVNGVRFNDTTANITNDDTTTPKTPADLKDGMVVKVRGRINDDRVTGTAERVEVENEVRGTVQTHNANATPPTFTVVGQTVFVDGQTTFANFALPTPTPSAAVVQLVDGISIVEVHGLRDPAGIHASRVEILNVNLLGDELRGIIKAGTLNTVAKTFTLQNGGATDVAVDYSAATINPATATLIVNALVEVHGAFNGATFAATRVDVEDQEDDEFRHGAGEEFEFEGLVSGCGNIIPCTSFSVGTQMVQTDGNTRFENGSREDLIDGARVEAEGHNFNGSTLIAEMIQFKRARVILTGPVTAFTGTIQGGTGYTGTITVLGKTVQVTTLTRVEANDNIINTTDRVEIRGFVDSTGTVVAERVDDTPGGNASRVILQARVDAKNVVLQTLVLLSITADLTTTQDANIKGTNDLPLPGGKAAFFAAISATSGNIPGTLVKVQGTFNSGTNTITVEEAELEN